MTPIDGITGKRAAENARGTIARLKAHGVAANGIVPVMEEDLLGERVRSADYGTGTVVAMLPTGIQVFWDKALLGTTDMHLLVHDRAWVLQLERL